MVTAVPEPPLDPVVGPVELEHAEKNPANTRPTATRYIITTSPFAELDGNSRAARRPSRIKVLSNGRVTTAGNAYHQRN